MDSLELSILPSQNLKLVQRDLSVWQKMFGPLGDNIFDVISEGHSKIGWIFSAIPSAELNWIRK